MEEGAFVKMEEDDALMAEEKKDKNK